MTDKEREHWQKQFNQKLKLDETSLQDMILELAERVSELESTVEFQGDLISDLDNKLRELE